VTTLVQAWAIGHELSIGRRSAQPGQADGMYWLTCGVNWARL